MIAANKAAVNGCINKPIEPFDAERYSIHYEDGAIETLNSDQVTITNGGANITFTGLSKTQNTKADYWKVTALGTPSENGRGGYFRQAANADARGKPPYAILEFPLTDVR